MSEVFGSYFSSINIISVLKHFGANQSRSCTTRSLTDNNFYFFPVEPEEVNSVMKNLKNKNGNGLDMIPVKVLKILAPHISKHLSHLINVSVSSGTFPSLLKTAEVIPIHKRNAVDDVNNYRPISLLSSLSKVIERLVYDRMLKYLDKYSFITTCQHGFRIGRSTESAACDLINFVYSCLDDGIFVAGLFFDQSRAFDCLSFNFILDKL